MSEGITAQHQYRAGWLRSILAVFGLTVGPYLMPSLAGYRPVLLVYLAVALGIQVMIKRNIGGEVRAVVGGIVDIALATFLVQRFGSASSSLVTLYVFIGMLMALVHRRRVALILAGVTSAAFGGVLLAESMGWLPYAPDAPAWAHYQTPDAMTLITSGLLVTILVFGATLVVCDLVGAVQKRELQLIRLNGELERLSQRDPLTQLFNRRLLVKRIEHELARVRRGYHMTLLMVDLDNFKRVNDLHGHLQGDALLKRIAGAVARTVRETDVVGRYGGDEFLIVLPDSETESGLGAAARVMAAVREASGSFEFENAVTASLGMALARIDDDAETLIRRADENAYRAKQNGGDQVVGEAAQSGVTGLGAASTG